MIRGATPTHIFRIPLDTGELKEVEVVYAQDDTVLVRKTIADCTLEEYTISIKLTQEDTMKFSHKKMVEQQLRVLTKSGDVLVQPVKRFNVGELLSNEVLK